MAFEEHVLTAFPAFLLFFPHSGPFLSSAPSAAPLTEHCAPQRRLTSHKPVQINASWESLAWPQGQSCAVQDS